ncbi:cyclic dehypoxanthinyl futalosine synthase [Ignicoccus hospitalis]|uniref:Radical SAM domain protein n=1 Tax=Ignicoccus hospitalis (strain KIN4/I / DSM 18386 / JCM 14125) TaxID=453591 RepID=A8AAU8_IGNH4|nr:cyclic dehypoxanthinyl futalosine synthase [Ignicoccus hospitalis]ABU82050.1 Radical SAM domain protein [Ignicoccus hospitalis KIN4/I]
MRTWERSDLAPIIEKALEGEKLSVKEVEELLSSWDLWALGEAANELKKRMYGNVCTYIKNMILNYTNECVVECKFCAFYRRVGEGYLLSPEAAAFAVERLAREKGIRQVLIQGGVNPKVDIEYFETMFREIRKRTPQVAIHALSPVEVDFLSKKHKISVKEVLSRLKEAGMESMPGGGAELLVERVRKILSPKKISVERWLEIVETAHNLGIPTSVTMMFGHVETVSERALHLIKLRELQERAPGSLAFIAWNFEPGNTELARERKIKYPYGGAELLRVIAVARLTFGDLIPHVQAGWLTVGKDVAQLALKWGADDWGGTLYEESVIPATGLKVKFPDEDDVRRWIEGAGCIAKERDNLYRVVE